MSDFVVLNGELVPYEDAHIAPFDSAVSHGAGLFETMRARHGRVFELHAHLNRLTASAQSLAMEIQLDPETIADSIEELLATEDLSDARIRLSVTRGDMRLTDSQHPDPPRTVLISAAPFIPYPATLYQSGMTVLVSRYRQNPRQPSTGHKTISYIDRLLALREAHLAGAGEALWFTALENALAEGCISNIFLVTPQGSLLTPPCDYPSEPTLRMALPGITRALVMKLSDAQSHPAQEKMLTIQDLLSAREVFLTNAIMGVMPVARIERHAIGDEKPGPLTEQLRNVYEQYFTEQTDGQR